MPLDSSGGIDQDGAGGVALYVRERLDCLQLKDGDSRVPCLWVRLRGRAKRQVAWWEEG